MRLTLAVLVLLALAAPAAAQLPGGVTSDNLEFVGNHPEPTGVNEGGRLVGSTFFTTSNAQGLLVFDASQPERPKLVGRLFLPHAAENEDVATNGRILLLSQLGDGYHLSTFAEEGARTGSVVNVIDVRDPAAPKVIATVDGGGDHTWECVLDCTWAYSASGLILDLRDPAKPKLLDHTWKDSARESSAGFVNGEEGPGFSHDVTEVAPGRIMTASTPMFLLDARRDPARPRVLAVSEPAPNAGHNVSWPNGATDRFLVTASESLIPGRCEASQNAALATWDASRWQTDRTFRPIDKFRPRNGTYTDGNPPASAVWYGCSAHWAEPHPTFRDGGLVAGAFYSHGVRLLQVDGAGKIKETGWFLAHGAGTSAVYWITDRILYAVDLDRGLDVLRYKGPLPERSRGSAAPGSPAPTGSATGTMPAAARPLVDRTAPRLRLVRRSLRGRRLALRLRCDEDCFGRVEAFSGRRHVGRREVKLRAGATTTVRLRVRSVRALRVRVRVTDRAGNATWRSAAIR